MSRQVMIVGGGASGLSAAIAAARAGAAVTILERLPRVGKKLLLTGNGRCNLGHSGHDFSRYHGTLPQAKQILSRFDTEVFFQQLGLYTRTDDEGRMYPCSNAAASVLDALRMEAARLGVTEITDCMVTDLQPQKNGAWLIFAGDAKYSADAVILAAGGAAAPACGTDGSLYPILKRLGHTIIPPMPALCPIPSDANLLRPLKGMRVRASVSAIAEGKVRGREVGEVQFTDTALSGICLFNLSRLAATEGGKLQISLDVLPESWQSDADGGLSKLTELTQIRANAACGDLLTGLLPKRVAEVLVKQAVGTAGGTVAELLVTDNAKIKLLRLLNDWRFPVCGKAKFAQAQVTAGGIAGQCVDASLASKIQKNLYFCGELLDVDGDCGGYNLDWAWASGAWAGHHAATSENKAR